MNRLMDTCGNVVTIIDIGAKYASLYSKLDIMCKARSKQLRYIAIRPNTDDYDQEYHAEHARTWTRAETHHSFIRDIIRAQFEPKWTNTDVAGHTTMSLPEANWSQTEYPIPQHLTRTLRTIHPLLNLPEVEMFDAEELEPELSPEPVFHGTDPDWIIQPEPDVMPKNPSLLLD